MCYDFIYLDEKYKLILNYYSVVKDFLNDLMKGGFVNYFNLINIDFDFDDV